MKPIKDSIFAQSILPGDTIADQPLWTVITETYDVDKESGAPIMKTGPLVTLYSSCWKMSWRERLRTLITGKVYLQVSNSYQPPVRLTLERPYNA